MKQILAKFKACEDCVLWAKIACGLGAFIIAMHFTVFLYLYLQDNTQAMQMNGR